MSVDFKAYTNAEDEASYFKESVDLLPEAIREEFTRVPADMGYWGEKYAEAVREYLLAEHEMKRTRALVIITIRETCAAKGQKPTVDLIEAYAEAAPEYQQAKLLQIEAEARKVAARCRLDAVSAKKDMVQSLGAHIRQEMGPTQINSYRKS